MAAPSEQGPCAEDFVVGETLRHARGKTVTDFETHTLSQLVMNTSEGHFNTDKMRDTEFGVAITFGGIVASLLFGLASQDTAEGARSELGIDRIRFQKPVKPGDTIYAESEVLAVDEDSGVVTFRHRAIDPDGEAVCAMDRRVALRRRSEDRSST
jgi:itaconyl-CoA hydratase